MAEARDPRTDIGDLFGQQAAAFLLIEKNDGSRRKSLAACGCNGGSSICAARFGSILIPELGIEPAIEQD